MTFLEFITCVEKNPHGVVLLEGRRVLPAPLAKQATQVATRFPNLRFRSGNAEGADQAFSDGVARVDASRLQILAPYASHRQSARYLGTTYDSPETMSSLQEELVAEKNVLATPTNQRCFNLPGSHGYPN